MSAWLARAERANRLTRAGALGQSAVGRGEKRALVSNDGAQRVKMARVDEPSSVGVGVCVGTQGGVLSLGIECPLAGGEGAARTRRRRLAEGDADEYRRVKVARVEPRPLVESDRVCSALGDPPD